MKRYLILILCLLLGLSFGCKAKKDPPAVQETAEPSTLPEPIAEATPAPVEATPVPVEETQMPEKEPDLVFDTVTLFGEPISSNILHEYDLIIVNCWAEWCGPCVGEMPELERVHQEYPNVLFLGVLLSDNVDGAKAVLDDTGVTYPILQPSGTLSEYDRRSQYIPATYFFDSTGCEIAEPVVGSMDYNEWKAVVEDLLP